MKRLLILGAGTAGTMVAANLRGPSSASAMSGRSR